MTRRRDEVLSLGISALETCTIGCAFENMFDHCMCVY